MEARNLEITMAFRVPAEHYLAIAKLAEQESKGVLAPVARRIMALGLEALRQQKQREEERA